MGMENHQLREKIVLLGIQAVEKFDGYYDRAKYISDELDRQEAGYWGCFIRDKEVTEQNKANICFTSFGSMRIDFRIGKCRITVLKQSE